MKVLVMLAHPDDELMCAGTLMKLMKEKDATVHVVVSCRPQKSHWDRETEFAASMKAMGITKYALWDEDELDFAWTMDQVVPWDLAAYATQPDLIISHRPRDSQQHHAHLANIAHSVARKNNISLWEMEQTMPGGIEPDAPNPNLFVDVSDYWYVKADIINAYPSQARKYANWLEGIEHRAKAWGWMTNMNGEAGWDTVRYVEAFRIVKHFWLG